MMDYETFKYLHKKLTKSFQDCTSLIQGFVKIQATVRSLLKKNHNKKKKNSTFFRFFLDRSKSAE